MVLLEARWEVVDTRWFGLHIGNVSGGRGFPRVYMITLRIGRKRQLEVVYK